MSKKWLDNLETVFEMMARISVVNPFRGVRLVFRCQKSGSSVVNQMVRANSIGTGCSLGLVPTSRHNGLDSFPGGFRAIPEKVAHPSTNGVWKDGTDICSGPTSGAELGLVCQKSGSFINKRCLKMWFVSRVPCSELQALQGFDIKISRKHDNKKT